MKLLSILLVSTYFFSNSALADSIRCGVTPKNLGQIIESQKQNNFELAPYFSNDFLLLIELIDIIKSSRNCLTAAQHAEACAGIYYPNVVYSKFIADHVEKVCEKEFVKSGGGSTQDFELVSNSLQSENKSLDQPSLAKNLAEKFAAMKMAVSSVKLNSFYENVFEKLDKLDDSEGARAFELQKLYGLSFDDAKGVSKRFSMCKMADIESRDCFKVVFGEYLEPLFLAMNDGSSPQDFYERIISHISVDGRYQPSMTTVKKMISDLMGLN